MNAGLGNILGAGTAYATTDAGKTAAAAMLDAYGKSRFPVQDAAGIGAIAANDVERIVGARRQADPVRGPPENG